MTKHVYAHNAQGFTLVELAISLAVIGLLLAGILKATELLENGRVTSTVSQAGHYEAAMLGFRSMYGSLPGDIVQPDRINGCTGSTYCNRAGNGDGMIYVDDASDLLGGTLDGESRRVWVQLAKAGLITTVEALNDGSVTHKGGVDYPATPFAGGVFDVHFRRTASATLGMQAGSHYLKTRGQPMGNADASSNLLTNLQAQKIDVKMDDGLPMTGRVYGWRGAGAVCRNAGGANEYAFYAAAADRNIKCDISIMLGF